MHEKKKIAPEKSLDCHDEQHIPITKSWLGVRARDMQRTIV
jgi:hypothetical protein